MIIHSPRLLKDQLTRLLASNDDAFDLHEFSTSLSLRRCLGRINSERELQSKQTKIRKITNYNHELRTYQIWSVGASDDGFADPQYRHVWSRTGHIRIFHEHVQHDK